MPLADFGLCCAVNEFGQKLICLFYFVTYNVYRESIAVVKKINVEFSPEIFVFPSTQNKWFKHKKALIVYSQI